MKDFIEQALRTESPRSPVCFEDNGRLFRDTKLSRLLHAGIGLNTEQAEFNDMLKKYLFYGKPLDETNLKEELGDLLWYVAIAMDALGTNFEAEMWRVVNKLRTRYPEKFNDVQAEHRDLEKERAVLEQQDEFCGIKFKAKGE